MAQNTWMFGEQTNANALIHEIRRQSNGHQFDLAVILGTGWGHAELDGSTLVQMQYSDWPCFPGGQIKGHPGRLLVVEKGGWRILVFAGRFHCYQGISAFEASFPVRLASALGTTRLLITCSTGGINPICCPGDFLLVEDHLNFLCDNPLRGLGGDIFIDTASLYRTDFFKDLQISAQKVNVRLHRGILAAMAGPNYETPAEVRMLASLGADVVSMSTVPEALMGKYCGMEIMALAFIANSAASVDGPSINHQAVLNCASAKIGAAEGVIRSAITCWRNFSSP